MDLNIYEFLGYEDTTADDKDVLDALQKEKQMWTYKMMIQPDRAISKLELIRILEAELKANPNMLSEHKKMFSNQNAMSFAVSEQTIIKLRKVGARFVSNGLINQECLSVLSKMFRLSEQDILKILGAKREIRRKRETVFGISFGTTYSCIACVDEYGKAVTIVNPETNSPVTPSVVYFPKAGEKPVVGEIAKAQMQDAPELVCSAIKRQIGKRDYKFEANGEKFTPEEIFALILKKLAAFACERLGENIKDVAIAYPSYYASDEKEAIMQAAKIAGLNLLCCVNETIAAAISYGYGIKADESQSILVYDLGGRTFDVSIIKVFDGTFEIVSCGGDHFLGGKDWDKAIEEIAISRYVEQTGESENDIETDIAMLGDLEIKSENAKKQLSRLPETTFKIGRAGTKVTITLEQFESDTASLLNSTIDLTDITIKEAKRKGVTQIDKILLVGGSTFMPQVKKCLTKKFPETPIEFCDPNESVAKGAAIYGTWINGERTCF